MISIPDCPQHKNDNPFGYTEDQLAEKKIALKTMHEIWPTVSPTHAEWVYDMCKNTNESKLLEIMKKCNGPGKSDPK
jgi:hypothetical protein